MQLSLDDTGGARELALYRIKTAKEDLNSAKPQVKICDLAFFDLC